MSWSVSAMGKGQSVGAKLAKELAIIYKMEQPEQAMKEKVAEIVKAATDGAPSRQSTISA